MELKDMLLTLIADHGFSQDSLAKELTLRGAGCTQPTVGRILKGTDPSFSVGDGIRHIYLEKTEDQAAA